MLPLPTCIWFLQVDAQISHINVAQDQYATCTAVAVMEFQTATTMQMNYSVVSELELLYLPNL